MLRLEEIKKDFKTDNNVVNVLKGITIQFRKQEFVAILGHSGCGKTTLLNIIGGLDKCTSGNVIIDGRSTKEYNDLDWNDYRNKRIGFVFQSYNLIPHLTVQKNVELSMTLAGVTKEERHARALEALDKVGLKAHARKHPSQLSGGQMQRVAIARAIVNNPEIILADEPTGALDSESGVEVMELLKEISKDHLIVMVTHNSQLADEYATRILNMSDGVIVGDTNEYTLNECLSDEATDLASKTAAEEKALSDIEQSGAKNAKRELKRIEKKKRKKASMSPLTAFSLSFTNLISKKGRTFLTSFAGSIGIIGIMLVLALSTGARSFISKMEENALSQYPIEISESNTDLSAILSLLTTDTAKRENYPSGDTIYTQQVIGNILENYTLLTSKNDLARLKSHIDNSFDETIGYVKYNYGTDFDVYCDYTHAKGDEDKYMKVQPFVDAIADIPALSGFKDQLEMFSSYLTVWDEMTDNTTLLNQQYELLGNSKWPTNYDEVVLVVDRKNQINDYTLFALGLKSKEDIGSALGGSTGGENSFSNSTFSISDIIGENGKEPLQYQIATGCDYYHKNGETGKWEKISARDDQRAKTFIDGEIDGRKNTVNVKVVGVVRPREDANVTSINGNIGYTAALSRYLSERASEHPLVKALNNDEVGISEIDPSTDFDSLMLKLGVSDVDKPKKIKIYASSFDSKEKILAFLDNYNATLQANGETPVKYSDNLSMIMAYVESMTATITGVLIGFAAISLIVSSIMIAIIIYTSVIERKKEIGVLRSIGARKLDVSGVFIAESGIIGCLSGVLGIAISYILILPINAVIAKLFSVQHLATLSWWQPLMMFGISVVLAVLAGFVPAHMAANKDPVECLRSE